MTQKQVRPRGYLGAAGALEAVAGAAAPSPEIGFGPGWLRSRSQPVNATTQSASATTTDRERNVRVTEISQVVLIDSL